MNVLAERKTSLGKDWHSACLRCEKCNKTLVPGRHAEHEGKPYCDKPCYSALFGPKGDHFITLTFFHTKKVGKCGKRIIITSHMYTLELSTTHYTNPNLRVV